MGAKTALLAFADGDLPAALRGATRSDRAAAEELVHRAHPGHGVVPIGDGSLLEDTNPPRGVAYATVLAGAELLCGGGLVLERPSELPEHLRAAGAGRRIVMHGMHSVVDWFCFAVWEDGELVRSLSLSPDGGIAENLGEPYHFERPYWAGEHPVEPDPGWPDQGPYPLPFHPLDLGEDALRALFGFVLEGLADPGDVDPEAVHLHGFQLTDQAGRDEAERVALEEAVRRMAPPRRFRMGPDGTPREVT